MTLAHFYKKLAWASLTSLLLIAVIYLVPILKPYTAFSGMCFVFFALICIAVFYVGRFLSRLSKSQYYTSFSLVFGVFKLFLLFTFVFIYVSKANPENSYYLIPFFVLYLIFTILETPRIDQAWLWKIILHSRSLYSTNVL